jgi:hypothetical protein
MKTNYSIQSKQVIESTPFATSYVRQTDSRTYVSYFKTSDGMIHSNQYNYSLVGRFPMSEIEFMNMDKGDYKVLFNSFNQ